MSYYFSHCFALKRYALKRLGATREQMRTASSQQQTDCLFLRTGSLRISFLATSGSRAVCLALLILFQYSYWCDTGIANASQTNSADLTWDSHTCSRSLARHRHLRCSTRAEQRLAPWSGLLLAVLLLTFQTYSVLQARASGIFKKRNNWCKS